MTTTSKPDCNPMEKLSTVVECSTRSSEAFRDLLQFKDDKIGRLDQFEERYKAIIRDTFSKYKELAYDHEKQFNLLQIRYNQEHSACQQSLDELRNEILLLKEKLVEQSSEIQDLEKQTKKWQQFQFSNFSTYANEPPIKAPLINQSPFLDRLRQDS